MSLDITKDVLAAVRAALPQAVGEELQARLAEGTRAIEACKTHDAAMAVAKDFVANAEKRLDTADTRIKALEADLKVLRGREKVFEASEHAFQLVELRLEMTKAMNEQALSMFGTVFKNATLRESVMAQVPVVRSYQPNGGSEYVEQQPSTTTRTTDRE